MRGDVMQLGMSRTSQFSINILPALRFEDNIVTDLLLVCFHFRPELLAVWNRLKYYILILKPWTVLFSGKIIRRLKKTDKVFWLCGIQSDTREMKTILSFHFYEGSISAETRLFQGFSLFFACSDFRPELFEVWKGLKYFNVYSTPSVWD